MGARAGRMRRCGWADFRLAVAVALRASSGAHVGNIARLVTVAPAFTGDYASPQQVRTPTCPWLIVQGDADEVIDPVTKSTGHGASVRAPQLGVLAGGGALLSWPAGCTARCGGAVPVRPARQQEARAENCRFSGPWRIPDISPANVLRWS